MVGVAVLRAKRMAPSPVRMLSGRRVSAEATLAGFLTRRMAETAP